MTRTNHNEYFMEIAYVIRTRSTCVRGQVGCLLVVDKRIIATGYNGAPSGASHCTEVGCDVPNPFLGCQRAIHAEANVIAFAARHGLRTEGSTLYCTAGPCLKCAQLILSAGISEVVYQVPYRLEDGVDLLAQAGVKIKQMPVNPQYTGRFTL